MPPSEKIAMKKRSTWTLIAGNSLLPLGVYSLFWWIDPPMIQAKGSSPIYEDPFDVGSGGASLTRASQAGMIFSNPALIPYGPGFHRWFGNESNVLIGKDSVDFAKSLQSGSGGGESSITDCP